MDNHINQFETEQDITDIDEVESEQDIADAPKNTFFSYLTSISPENSILISVVAVSHTDIMLLYIVLGCVIALLYAFLAFEILEL